MPRAMSCHCPVASPGGVRAAASFSPPRPLRHRDGTPAASGAIAYRASWMGTTLVTPAVMPVGKPLRAMSDLDGWLPNRTWLAALGPLKPQKAVSFPPLNPLIAAMLTPTGKQSGMPNAVVTTPPPPARMGTSLHVVAAPITSRMSEAGWPLGSGPAGGAQPALSSSVPVSFGPSPLGHACPNGSIAEPATSRSRWMRSRARRMFCWRSLSAGSRRKAPCPAFSSPKMAPLMIMVTSTATSSSIKLNPASLRVVFMEASCARAMSVRGPEGGEAGLAPEGHRRGHRLRDQVDEVDRHRVGLHLLDLPLHVHGALSRHDRVPLLDGGDQVRAVVAQRVRRGMRVRNDDTASRHQALERGRLQQVHPLGRHGRI